MFKFGDTTDDTHPWRVIVLDGIFFSIPSDKNPMLKFRTDDTVDTHPWRIRVPDRIINSVGDNRMHEIQRQDGSHCNAHLAFYLRIAYLSRIPSFPVSTSEPNQPSLVFRQPRLHLRVGICRKRLKMKKNQNGLTLFKTVVLKWLNEQRENIIMP